MAEDSGNTTIDLMDSFPARRGEVIYEGYIKLKLVHANGFSVLVPDLLIVDDGLWFAPVFFTAPFLTFFHEAAYAQFEFEIANNMPLLVAITRDRLVRSYDDGSFLYRARFSGTEHLVQFASGRCSLDDDNVIWLELFHHTSENSAAAILESGHFLGSKWNIQGNKELKHVSYAYFTSLPKIRDEQDLQTVAMASNGLIRFMPTNGSPNDVVELEVYRESTSNRRHALSALVPSHAVAPQHIWRHDPHSDPTYYEVSRPAIFRVGLAPGAVLPYDGSRIDISRTHLKKFGHVILGNADTRKGLLAPYNEEDTDEIFIIQRCDDLFSFWLQNANTDQFSQNISSAKKGTSKGETA